MPQYICHHEGKYLLWSTVIDAPETYAGSEQDIRDHIREETGRQGLHDIEERLRRARETGTSMRNSTLRDVVLYNHAGPDGEEITYDDVIRFYFVECRKPDATATILDRRRMDDPA